MNIITVLGAGMVGGAIAADLSKNYSVTLADINEYRLKELSTGLPIKTLTKDLSDSSQLKEVINNADLVVCAVPGYMGFRTLRTVIESGKNVVDISFFSEDPFELDELAKKNNVTAVVDCGVAPGLSNLILGYHNQRMNVAKFECYVGGLPFERKWPYEYKAPFSPVDVIEEYTRPARLVENGRIVVKEALSDPGLIQTEVGSLEAFNTDGLRSLLRTMKIPDMKEKTLRYPGHIGLMKVLRETGFFKKEEIDINGTMVSPLALSSKLLFPLWKPEQNEKEFTILIIRITGEGQTFEYSLFDRFDETTKTSSMARTTGYTCTAAVNLVLKGFYQEKGISPPEFIGRDQTCFSEILKYLADRGVVIQKK
jgi:lysine 6-dehydrogenase